MKSPALEALCAKGVFQIFYPFLMLTFQIIQYTNTPNYMTQSLKPLNLWTINLKDESFHDSL